MSGNTQIPAETFAKSAPLRSATRWFFRKYPFASGYGAVACSRVAKVLCPPSADLVWADIRGIRCPVPLNDLVGRSMYLMGDLDPKLTWVIDRVLSPGDTALDAGANLGLMTALIASRVGEHGRVLAFEPSPLMQERLRRMKAANPGIPVELFPVALGRAQGESELRVPPGNAGQASLLDHPDRPVEHVFKVRVEPLSAILEQCGITEVRLLKIDVEGFESEVLTGLFTGPSPVMPQVILFEENRPRTATTFSILKAKGYDLFALPRRLIRVALIGQGDPDFVRAHDFVAIHHQAPADIRARLGV